MLAPQFGNATHLLLSQPDHLGTQLPLLLVFLLLDRAPRRWYIRSRPARCSPGSSSPTGWRLLDAVVPLVLVCGARALLAVLRHRKSLASQWYELSLVAASVLSFVAATLAVRLISDLGGYQVTPVKSATLAPLHTLPHRVVIALEGILNVYGADFFHISQNSPVGARPGRPAAGRRGRPRRGAPGRRGPGGVGLLPRVPALFDPSDLISPVLATAIAVNVAGYVLSIVSAGLFDAREDPGRAALRRRPRGAHGHRFAGQGAAGPGAAHACGDRRPGGRAGLLPSRAGYGAAQSPVPDSMQAVIPWLEAHHLTHGLGTYAESNLITMDSGGHVEIRGRCGWRIRRRSSAPLRDQVVLDDPRYSYANFILTNGADHLGMTGGANRLVSMIPRSAIAAHARRASAPRMFYHYKTFTIHGLEP